MMMLVRNVVVRAELDVVMSDQCDDVREKISALEGKIFEDEVPRIVIVLDARNGKVANLPFL